MRSVNDTDDGLIDNWNNIIKTLQSHENDLNPQLHVLYFL